MARNLDLTTLRSFVAVAETGGMTKAAGFLHLTQSAVSMQLKRLEESLDLELLDRSGRSVTLTAAGEQLFSYAKRMLELNDEAWGRLTANEFEGEITLGAPHDIIYPYIPSILKRFAQDFPRMQVRLVSASTRRLREMFGRGECDIILTTEEQPGPGGEVLVELPLRWVGAVGGSAWRKTPLPVAFCSQCIFRGQVVRRLDSAGINWESVVESEMDAVVDAMVSADIGVFAAIDGFNPRQTAPIDHRGALPDPGNTQIVLYLPQGMDTVPHALSEMIRQTYRTESMTETDRLLAQTA